MEGPQTHALAEHLAEALCGQPITRLDLPAGRWQANVLLLNCAGQAIQRIRAHGKWLLFDLSHGVSWACHLLAKASWRVSTGPAAARPLLTMTLRNGVTASLTGRPLFLILPTSTLMDHPQLRGLGPDPLGDEAEFAAEFPARLRAAATRSLAGALLDQEIVAGVGNVLKCELLFAARLHPATRVGALLASQVEGLGPALRTLCQRHLEHHRACYAGKITHAEELLAVYDRADEPCPRCGGAIAVDRSGGDGHWTWYCPGCQGAADGPRGLFGALS